MFSHKKVHIPEFRLNIVTFSGIEFEVITPDAATQYLGHLTWGYGDHQEDVAPFDWDKDEGHFLLAREIATCEHLHLEYDDLPDDLIISGIIFAKDLNVKFGVISQEVDISPYFVVLGNCSARALALSGNRHIVMGDLNVSEIIYGKYNHGCLYVQGATTTQAIIADDFEMHFHDLACAVVVNDDERIKKLIPCEQDAETEKVVYAKMDVISTHTIDQIIPDHRVAADYDSCDQWLVAAISELSDASPPILDRLTRG